MNHKEQVKKILQKIEQKNATKELDMTYNNYSVIIEELDDHLMTLQNKIKDFNTQQHEQRKLLDDFKNTMTSVSSAERDVHQKKSGNISKKKPKNDNVPRKIVYKAKQTRQNLFGKQTKELAEYKTKVIEMETKFLQQESFYLEEIAQLTKKKMKLESQLEKLKRSNVLVKSELRSVKEQFKMLSDQLEMRCEELKKHNKSLIEDVRLFNKVLTKFPEVIKQIISEDDELAAALQ